MLTFLSGFFRNSITATFLAGLIVLLPVVLTVVIIAWIAEFVQGALGPGTFFGNLLTFGGRSVIGEGKETLAFLLGMTIALAGIWLLGVMVRTQARKGIQEAVDTLFARMPLVRTIYQPVSKLIRLTTSGQGGDLAGMSVVACRFGGADGADVLALLASRELYFIGGEPRRLIFLPSSPVPMTGGLIMVRDDAVIPVPDMKVDDLVRLYLSLGALAGESFPASAKSRLGSAAPPAVPVPGHEAATAAAAAYPAPDAPAETRI